METLFTAIVGNPPYQAETHSDVASHTYMPPIYHYFYQLASELSQQYALLTPARFLTNIGATPAEFNEYMLTSPHVSVLKYFNDASTLFDGVNIKGGVVAIHYNQNTVVDPINIFIEDSLLASIVHKVNQKTARDNTPTLDSLVAKRSLFKIDKILEDYPELLSRYPESHNRDKVIQSNAFAMYHELFTRTPDSKHTIGIYGRLNGERVTRYISPEYVEVDKDTQDKYRVLLSRNTGNGIFGEKISEPAILYPSTLYTDTFKAMGLFDSIEEAERLAVYLKTKFARALISVLKKTPNMQPRVLRYVPVQDFSSASDIDWSVSVSGVDSQLYAKYGLSVDEIEYIEQNVQDME